MLALLFLILWCALAVPPLSVEPCLMARLVYSILGPIFQVFFGDPALISAPFGHEYP